MVYLLFLRMLCASYGFASLKSTKWLLLYELQEEKVDNFQGSVEVGRGGSNIHGTIATRAILRGIRRGNARWHVHHQRNHYRGQFLLPPSLCLMKKKERAL